MLRAIALEVPGLCVVAQQRVGHIGCVDLLDHRLGLVIEAESYQWHSSRTALARDVRRYTWCARLGYTVVRFTWEEVMFQPDYVRAVLLDLVALGPARGQFSVLRPDPSVRAPNCPRGWPPSPAPVARLPVPGRGAGRVVVSTSSTSE